MDEAFKPEHSAIVQSKDEDRVVMSIESDHLRHVIVGERLTRQANPSGLQSLRIRKAQIARTRGAELRRHVLTCADGGRNKSHEHSCVHRWCQSLVSVGAASYDHDEGPGCCLV